MDRYYLAYSKLSVNPRLIGCTYVIYDENTLGTLTAQTNANFQDYVKANHPR